MGGEKPVSGWSSEGGYKLKDSGDSQSGSGEGFGLADFAGRYRYAMTPRRWNGCIPPPEKNLDTDTLPVCSGGRVVIILVSRLAYFSDTAPQGDNHKGLRTAH